MSSYEPTWESLRGHGIPEWFRDAKFGIWAHWGPQSVAQAGDWYARHLYGVYAGTEDFERERAQRQHDLHLRRYGRPAIFGHKDLCHRWRAEKFDPEELIALYKNAGARYFMSMAVHCDNFDLWDSAHQPWNAVTVGPHSNILGRWERAARAVGLYFGVSVHNGSWTWRWFDSAFAADSDGHLTKANGAGTWWEGLAPQQLYGRPRRPGEPPDPDFIDNYYARLRDVTAKYRPELIYLDDSRLPFDSGSVCEGKPSSRAGLEFLADYYQRPDVTVSIKTVPDEDRSAILLDVERGQLDDAQQAPWQFDTSIGDWFYRTGERYKSPRQIIHLLVDTVSKNGCLLLNVMQRPDGTIDDETRDILRAIGRWLDVAGEAIYETRPWTVFGEGPTRVVKRPGYNEADLPYTPEDIRFTRRGDTVYAILLDWPASGLARIRSLDRDPSTVELVGREGALRWHRGTDALVVELPPTATTAHAYPLRIRLG